MSDWALRGGQVIDGLGGARYAADVVITDGRIDRILAPGTPALAEDIDVTGLAVAPGFIDMHAHSDLAVLADGQHLSKVAQGVTLEVVGQDGLGYAPVTDEVMAAVREQIVAWNGNPPLDYAWRSIADYLAEVDRGAAVNVAVLVPHGTARMTVMGTSPRAATPAELRQIQEIVAQGLLDGAMGMSTGLTYTPGMYASDDELVDALDAVRRIGGFYCTHHRNYGSQVLEAYRDCITVARRANVPLHLSHCNVNFPRNRGRAPEVLAAIDEGLADGVDISLDSYPYLAGATNLASLLPSWAHADGSEATIALLADPASRKRIMHEMEVDGADGFHGIPVDWSIVGISLVGSPELGWATGKSVAELAREKGQAPADVFADLLIADRLATGGVLQFGNEENVRTIMRHSVHTIGSDGVLVGDRPHPRGWGTFPRFLGTYARELGLMSMEEAVAHATSRAAKRLRLADRGVIAEGFRADVVVFDPDTVASPATYEAPRQSPVGIEYVFVNGELTLQQGRRTSALPGRAIRPQLARR
jgi:N-acyl-D-amino-acid deacylase